MRVMETAVIAVRTNKTDLLITWIASRDYTVHHSDLR